jgi:hypothetical protein
VALMAKSSGQRTATVRAVGDTKCLRLRQETFNLIVGDTVKATLSRRTSMYPK